MRNKYIQVQLPGPLDEYLLRKILKAPASTSKESLYLETGCTPVKFLIMKRLLMYYHHIVTRSKQELIYKFYKAQKLSPTKGDWVELLKEDEKILQINLNDEEIAKMSKNKFKEIINKDINRAAFDYLMKIKIKHTKLDGLKYERLATQEYLKTNNSLSYEEKCTLYKMRVREIDVKVNYKTKYVDIKCTLCNTGKESSQYHLLECEYLIERCENLANNIDIEYEDIFDNVDKQIPAAKLLHEVWKIAKE